MCLAFASVLTLACNDNIPSSPNEPRRAASPLAPATEPFHAPGATLLVGRAADSALRARAREQAQSGDQRLAVYLDTSTTWNSALHRSSMFASATTELPAHGTPDLTGTGTPPNVVGASYFPKPEIVSSQTVASLSGATATFSSSMIYVNGTSGSTALTHEVRGSHDQPYPQRVANFSEIANGVVDCISDIAQHPTNPMCYLWGSVTGLVSVGLSRSCDLTAIASSLHTAHLVLPLPSISIGNGGGWSISLFSANISDAYGGDGASTASSGPCEPVKETKKIAVSEGGDTGGQWIIFPPEMPAATWKCYADQERTVQSDGSASAWVTVHVDCGLYASMGIDMNGQLPNASSATAGSSRATIVPFTLAGVASLPKKDRAQVIRRSSSHASSEPDVIALSDDATENDLGDAVNQFLSANGTTRPGADATQTVSNAGKGNSKQIAQSKAYANLLKDLRKAAHKNVDAVGDAAAINVLIIQ
jgi:hypothetical protein